MVQLKAYNLAGAPRLLYLPDNIELIVDLVRHPNVNNGVVRLPKTSDTWHDTGNPRTNAAGEMQWLRNGRPGGEAGGYNFIVGTRKVYHCGRLDWETWHAGVQRGNWYSLGTEHAYGADEDWNGSLETACWLHAAILECYDFGMDVFFWHRAWYGKYCPAQIFNRGLENWVIAEIAEKRAFIRGYRNQIHTGTIDETTKPTVYATPSLPVVNGKTWDGTADMLVGTTRFEAQKTSGVLVKSATNTRQYASSESLLTGPGYKQGDRIDLLGWVKGQLVNGVSEWAVDTKGNRVWCGNLEFTPKTDPDWAELPGETGPGVKSVNGRLYYPLLDETTGELGREMDINRPGNLWQWAGVGSAIVGSVKAGEVRRFKYWTKGDAVELTMADGTIALENIWYAEDLMTGARMWAGLTEERPN